MVLSYYHAGGPWQHTLAPGVMVGFAASAPLPAQLPRTSGMWERRLPGTLARGGFPCATLATMRPLAAGSARRFEPRPAGILHSRSTGRFVEPPASPGPRTPGQVQYGVSRCIPRAVAGLAEQPKHGPARPPGVRCRRGRAPRGSMRRFRRGARPRRTRCGTVRESNEGGADAASLECRDLREWIPGGRSADLRVPRKGSDGASDPPPGVRKPMTPQKARVETSTITAIRIPIMYRMEAPNALRYLRRPTTLR